jgi:hypothetical protein
MALAVFHSFARSGGTLVNRCLGAMAGNLVLSEVNPHGAVVPMEVQARDWLGLVAPGAVEPFSRQAYGSRIRTLEEAARRQGQFLVVRDWTSLNFVPRLFFTYHEPSGLLEQDLYLAHAGLEYRSAVVARRAAAVYESIVRTFAHLRHLSAAEFGAFYLAYATAVAGRPVVRLDELCQEPEREMEKLCGWLGVSYSRSFLGDFSRFERCTGDNLIAPLAAPGRSGRIEVVPDRRDEPAWISASRDPGCREADILFGYA